MVKYGWLHLTAPAPVMFQLSLSTILFYLLLYTSLFRYQALTLHSNLQYTLFRLSSLFFCLPCSAKSGRREIKAVNLRLAEVRDFPNPRTTVCCI